MSQWLLVRHGQSEWNAEGRIQGGSSTTLNKEGVRQSQLLAARLADTPLRAIYSSDNPRARETADILAAPHRLRVEPVAELRERSFGQWEGLTYDEVRTRDPQAYARWQKGGEDFIPPNGESISEVTVRALRFASKLRAEHPNDEAVLVVGHGSCLHFLAIGVLGLPASTRRGLAPLDNASLSALDGSPEGVILRVWNDTAHWHGVISGPGVLGLAW